jgi:hypothetical protein
MFHFLTLKIKELKIHIPVYYLCYSNCDLPSCCQLQSCLLLMFLTTRVAQSFAFPTFTFQYGAGTLCFISLTETLHTFKLFDNKLRLGLRKRQSDVKYFVLPTQHFCGWFLSSISFHHIRSEQVSQKFALC